MVRPTIGPKPTIRQMKLVPQDVLTQALAQVQQERNVTITGDMRRILDLDTEMQRVLESKVTDVDTKLKLYQQAFKRYLFLRNRLTNDGQGDVPMLPNAAPAPETQAPAEEAPTPQHARPLATEMSTAGDEADVLETPKSVSNRSTIELQPKTKNSTKAARALLKRISQMTGVGHNSRGDLLINGERVLDTNLYSTVHLLSCRKNKHPVPITPGMQQLVMKLQEKGLRRADVVNKDVWSRIIDSEPSTSRSWATIDSDSTVGARSRHKKPQVLRSSGSGEDETPRTSRQRTQKTAANKTTGWQQVKWSSYKL